MIKRISVMCLLVLYTYTSFCMAWSSGIMERKKYHYDNDTYIHSYAVRTRFDTQEKNVSFLLEIKYNTKNEKTIKIPSIYIITQKKGLVKPYTPKKATLTMDNNVWMPINGELNIGWDEDSNKTLHMILSEYEIELVKRLFDKDRATIGLTVYTTNGKVYRYSFDNEQIIEIRELLTK